jgi:WD40 repeat protein
MMLIEYVGSKFSRLRWKAAQVPSTEGVFVAGTWDNGPTNKLAVYSVDSSNPSAVEFVARHQVGVRGDVTQICTFQQDHVAAVTTTGQLSLYSLPEHQLLKQHELIVGNKTVVNDVAYSDFTKELITCDGDGNVDIFNVESGSLNTGINLSQTSLECVDVMSGHQVILGNSAGHLKVLDTRQRSPSMSLPGTLSAVLSVRRNPSNNHVVASGNAKGQVCLWDLRQTTSLLLQLDAHTSSITDMYYDQKDGSAFYSSANDGQLLKWNIEANMTLQQVDCICGKPNGPPISSFDINYDNDLIFTADNETLGFGQL